MEYNEVTVEDIDNYYKEIIHITIEPELENIINTFFPNYR